MKLKRYAWILLLMLLLAVALMEREPVSHLLFLWTGETELPQQIKGVTDLTADMLRPKPETEDLVPVRYADVNPFGVNTFLEQEADPAKRERAVRMIADAGFHWIRQEFPWEDIEISGKGDFWDHKWNHSAWDKYDQIVGLAEKYHLELIVRLSNPPAWSRAGGDSVGTYAPPDDYDDFGDFVATVVRRYKGRIRYYQIWNEPNIYPEWGNRPVNPEEYTRLLCTAYRRAKEADPDVVIIAGALASTIELGPRDMNDFLFLQRMYDAGAKNCFDVMAMQGYGLWSGPTDRRMYPRVINFSRPRYIRDIMVKNGDADKAIWISEMNWNAVPDSVPDKRFGQVTPEEQARYVPAAYERIRDDGPWIGVVNFWYFKRATDRWEREQKPEAYFRMVTPDFTPQPVYWSMKEYMHRSPVVHYGHHQETLWALRWVGDWHREDVDSAEFGKARVAGRAGDELIFDFDGRGLALRILGTDRVSVEVDGKRKEFAVDGGLLRVSKGLKKGDHHVVLTAERVGTAVDAVIVYR
jgi:hypothetical protein